MGVDPQAAGVPVRRHSARVLLLDPDSRVLLLRGGDPARPEHIVWHVPGGGIEPGEEETDAARREVKEETGFELGALEGPVWTRRFVFSFDNVTYDQSETYYIAQVTGTDVDTSGHNDLERRYLTGHRWWSVAEMAASDELIAPPDIADQLAALLRDGFRGLPVQVAGAFQL